MSKWVRQAEPCPCGESSDAFSVDTEGRGYCFGSCGGKHFSKSEVDQHDGGVKVEPEEGEQVSKVQGNYGLYPSRGLTERTLDHYGIKTKFVDGEPYETGFNYSDVGFKVRLLQEKKFHWVGDAKKFPLFGMNCFDQGSLTSVTITEGEYDAASIYQVTGGQTAAVSVRSSVTAHGDCARTFDWLNSFSKIYLCFDNDEAGRKAVEKIAPMFDFKKLYIVKLTRFKDANDYLQNHEGPALLAAWENARRYSPDNIISSFNDVAEILKEKQNAKVGTYPFKGLQTSLKGLHKGEFVLFKGEEGIGKTEIFRAIEYHNLTQDKVPIGILHFEESNNTSIRGLATYELKEPAAMDESPVSDEQVLEAYKKIVGGSEDMLFIRKSYDLDDTQAIIDNIRYMVAGCGCQVVFFDHISWLAASSETDDERKKLDALSQKFKMLCEELHFCIVVISHVNDDGKTRGSRYISKVANTVIHMSRNKTDLDVHERMKTYFTVEKGRAQGTQTGPAGFGIYSLDTYTLEDGEVDD